MPFYEYECTACNHQVEVLQKISDAPLRQCPDCGKSALKRLISAPVFRLKGAGWYETDFKSDKEEKRNIAGREEAEAKSEDKSESKDAKPADGKSDSKPEAAKVEPKVEVKSERKSVPKPVKASAPSKPKPKPKAKAKSKAVKKKAGRR